MPISAPYDVVVKKPYVNLLVHGPPGAGKTVLAATAQEHPDMQNVLFLNIEGGLLSLGTKKGVKAVDIRRVDDLEEVFWKLVNKEPGWDKYQTVVIDSGSELETLSLQGIASDAFDDAKARHKEKSKRTSIDDLWQEDYGKNSARLKRVFRWFRDAPFHVIITALSKKVFSKPPDKNTEPVLLDVVPSFTDKLCTSVMGYCDFVWYMYQDEEGKRHLLTQPKGVYRAKTRGVKFPVAIGPVVAEPNLAKLYAQLLKSESEETK